MDELSERAQVVLGGLHDGMTPGELQRVVAWARIENEIERRAAARSWRRRSLRGYRFVVGYMRRVWKPVLVMTIVALALGPVLRGDIGGPAHLEMARSLIAQGEHRRAYNILVDHARLYRTRSAAEARMGLVLDALCGLSMHDKAATDLRRYLELNPESAHADRVDALCPG